MKEWEIPNCLKPPECIHDNVDYDLKDGVEMHGMGNRLVVTIKTKCTDCGAEGEYLFSYVKEEWK